MLLLIFALKIGYLLANCVFYYVANLFGSYEIA